MLNELIDESIVPVKFVEEAWGEFKFEGGIMDGKYEALPCDATERTKLIYGDRVDAKGHKVDVLKYFYVKEGDVFVLKSIKAINRVY